MKKIHIVLADIFFITFLLFSQAFAVSNNEPPNSANVFRVLDISERTYDNGPAIAVLLSKPLDSKIRHDQHLRISDTKEMLKSAWILSQDCRTLWFPHIDPEMEYSISVLKTLQAADGQMLEKRVSKTIVTRKIVPIISFASEGFLLPVKLNKGLPVVTINVKSVYIEFFRLNDKGLVKFVNWKNTTSKRGYYKLSRVKKYGDMVFSGRFDLDVKKNQRTVYHIPLDIEALQKPGVYLAIMREPGQYDYNYQTTYFLITDIGLHARAYKNKSLIFVSSLKTGIPLSKVQLTFFNKNGEVIEKGLTDSEGRYNYSYKLPGEVKIITAKHKEQIGVLPMKIPALDMSEFELGKRKYKPREVFLYSPRNLYRPGEIVILSALLRNHDGKAIETLPLKARLYQPDGKEVKSFTWQTKKLASSDLNYYQKELELPVDAQTGLWNLKVWDNPSSNIPVSIYNFHVEEFLPERMKLDLAVNPNFEIENPLQIDITGQYLYGAPASGNKIGAKARIKAKRNLSNQFKGFEFGDIDDKSYQDFWEIPEKKLDKLGNFTLEIPSRWKDIKSPMSVRVAVDLFESGGRPVTRAVDKDIWPAKSLIGIRPLFDLESSVDEGPVNFEIIKINSDETLESGKGLLVELTKEDRDYYWEYSESTGWLYKYTQKNYQFLTNTLNTKQDKPTPYNLHLQKGQYVLSIKNPETNLTSSIRFRVGYWWYGDNQGDGARPDKVVMALDKPAYQAGDIINLTITPPHSGQAVITLESEKPLWVKRIPVSAKGTKVEIPMLAGWDTHNLYISAVVFRPGDAKEKITPNRALGLIHLPLDRTQRKLNISIDAPEKAAPQGPIKVKLKLDKQKQKNAFVSLAAVDVGILNITDFKTPDPFKYFFEKRRYDVNAYDVYAKVIEHMDGNLAALRYGGDADLAGGKRPETKVKLLSLFQEPVSFDENGEAWITFNIPDFNGRLRLMAVAFDTHEFGSSEKDVVVAAPVVTQLAMPRFLSPGDSSKFTLDINNLSGETQNINLILKTDGPVEIENNEKSITLKDQEKSTLKFPVTAKADYGTCHINLELTSDKINLSRNWQIIVRPGYPASTKKIFKILAKGESFYLDPELIKNLIPNTIDAEMKISSTLPLEFQNAMKGLITYPYGCLEQTTSRAYPLLFATPEQISKYNLPIITSDERIKRLNKAVERLAAMQLASGGFGLWNKNSSEASWLSVYVTDFMLTARDLGVDIPEKMLDNALKRMEIYLKRGAPLDNYITNKSKEHLDFSIRSYAAYVLARLNRAPLGTLRTLYDNYHKKTDSCLPLTYIGIALKHMGDMKRSQEALELATQKRTSKYGYWGDYSSLIRDLALSLGLFIEYKLEHIQGFDKFITDLDNAVHQRQWMSTQEKYAIFKAGIELNQKSGKQWQGKLNLSGADTPLSHKGSYFINLNPEQIHNNVNFISENPDPIYVSVIIEGYTQKPLPKEDEQISIEREYFDLYGNPVNKTEFNVGELLMVHLKISAKEWIPDALVADLLPAGFEVENQNLKHSFKIEDMKIDGKSLWKLKQEADILHEEYRDDRYVAAVKLNDYEITHLFYLVRVVSPGTFSAAPAFVESMYRPEIRGIGSTPEPIKVINKSN